MERTTPTVNVINVDKSVAVEVAVNIGVFWINAEDSKPAGRMQNQLGETVLI